MNFRKAINVTICTSMLLALAAGCGEKDESNLKTVQIWSGNSHSKVAVSKLVEGFNETRGKELGVKVEYVVKGGESEQAIELAYETGDEPEYCSSGSVQQLSEQGRIVAINDLPGGEEFLASFPKGSYDNFTYDGKTYKVPYGITPVGLVYNKDMFKKYGIVDENGEAKPPETLAEMREYAKKMTNEAQQEYGFIIPLKTDWVYGVEVANIAAASSNHLTYDWAAGKYDFTTHKPVYEFYQGMKDDGSIFPGVINMDNDAARAQFAMGKIAMKFGASYDVGVYNEQFPASCDWGVAPVPTVKKGERYRVPYSSTGCLMINKKAVDRLGEETAFEIFKWFHGDEVMAELYKEGMEIPCKPEIVNSVSIEDAKKGWVDFAGLVGMSYNDSWNVPKVVRSGELSETKYFLNEFWSGNKTADEAVEYLTKSFNDGMQRWFEQNPDKKIEDYIIPDNNNIRIE
ncbi:MAG: extracellular solute-binding protein [Clostridia bacterium]|nr:extracellular solute-binding protein [Clostridia bacterium]